MKLYVDCESVGLSGPVKLIQFAVDDGPVQFIPLPRGWERNPASNHALSALFGHLYSPDTLFIGYNTSFDLFKLYQTAHRKAGLLYASSERPVTPFACRVLDLYVPATQKSPLAPFAYSKGASRSIAAVRKIPRVVADVVGDRVESALRPLIPTVVELKRHEREVPGRRDLVSLAWTTDGRMSLKNLMRTYGLPTMRLDEVWPLPERGSEKLHLPYPTEVHYALEPACDLILSDRSLPFWAYAELDIHYLRVLEERLGYPAPDHHSTCTHVVAYSRYYGFPLDRDILHRTRSAYARKVEEAKRALAGVDLASPKQRLALLRQTDPLIASSSKKVIQVLADSDRPSAPAARAMIDYGVYSQRLNQVDKVRESLTGRAHPDFRVMGTRTGRMAGTAGLNWQGIPTAKGGFGIRAAMGTCAGGDFSQFEVCIAAAAFPDEAIQEDIDQGIDQHSMNAVLMSPDVQRLGWDYPEMVRRIGEKDEKAVGIRKRMKAVSFALQYFAAAPKIAESLGVSMSDAEEALSRYYSRYSGFAKYRKRIERETQTADTDHWSRESVSRMAQSVTDLTGYEIRWDFEAQVADALWRLGGSGVRTGREGTIVRVTEKGAQTYDGAVRSALLGGAIAIQSAVSRQRGNARVQATGANLTKMLMAQIWSALRVPCINVHDELQFSPHINYDHERVSSHINQFISYWKETVKSIRFDFAATSKWSDK